MNMTARMELYEDLIMHISPEKIFIEPLQNLGFEMLIIDRVSKEISLTVPVTIPENAISKPICGILGIITLLAGDYLIVVTKKINIGELKGHNIWRILATDLIPYSKTDMHLTEKQIQDNRSFEAMIQQVLQTEYFYFSYTYDLTYSAQRLFNSPPEFLQIPLHLRADSRFMWNSHILSPLARKPEFNKYCLPIIHGFVAINNSCINERKFKWILISRRSCLRAGTRLFIRGVDMDGNTANFVETEQMVLYDGHLCSFVQTRGSIPLFWTQKPDLKIKPKPTLTVTNNHMIAFVKHFQNQLEIYGKQTLVNLIDHKGAEQKLERRYAESVATLNNPNIRYESFDFHHECRKMRYDKLSILMERLTRDQEEFGYFVLLSDGSVPLQQDGVFRTNCIDCLDRTNVVQSLLARRSLQSQLERLGILMVGQRFEHQREFEANYKNVWADHADMCSIQYAGSGALKTDYTRTGKRSFKGVLKDLMNSLTRYYKNNLTDGFRQDSIDLFLGKYVVEEGDTRVSPLQQERDFKYLLLPLIFLVAIAMSCLTLIIPTEIGLEIMLYFLFWVAMTMVGLLVILHYGVEFVDHPKLCWEWKRKAD